MTIMASKKGNQFKEKGEIVILGLKVNSKGR